MKKLVFVSLFAIISSSLFAQKFIDSNNPDEVKSLLNKDNDVTGFGGLETRFGTFNSVRSLFTGAYGGVIVNRHYFLGLAGYGLVTENQFTGQVPGFDNPKQLDIYGGYGGLLIGGIIAPKHVVHVSIPVLLGVGNIYISDENFFNNTIDTDFTIDRSTFFVVEPGISIEVNITSSFRIAIGSTYRLVSGTSLNQPVDDQDLSDWSGSFSLRFGRF